MLQKKYLFLIMLVCLFVISAVSAEDNSTSDIISISNDDSSLEANILEINEDSTTESVNDTGTLKVSNDEILTARNTNWYVNGSVTTTGNGSINNPYKTLKEAINNASDDDVIYIASGIYTSSKDVGLSINKKLNLVKWGDENPIFDANSTYRIFSINANFFNIEGLTFKNGKDSRGASAIYFSGSNCSVVNCSFIDCSSMNSNYYFGGAIYFSGSNCSVINCSFVNCSSFRSECGGGAIHFQKSGNVVNCSFMNCSSSSVAGSSYGGGAIYFGGSGNLTDCRFVDCGYTLGGGAIYFKGFGNVSNCSFVNCSSFSSTIGSSHGGGAIYFNCSGNVTDCSFVKCSSSYGGGAIYFNGFGNVSNCSFINCSSSIKKNNGDAIYFNDFGNVSNCIFINCISNSRVSSNSNYGGTIYFKKSGNTINCSFINCSSLSSSSSYGGAIYFKESGNVVNCSFINCSSSSSNHGSSYGGAIYFNGLGDVSNCSFINCSSSSSNQGSSYGGAIYFSGFGNIVNCSFVNCSSSSSNYGSSYGGAIYFNGLGDVSNCSFVNCSSSIFSSDSDFSSGGAIYFNESSNVTDCMFVNCYSFSSSHGSGGAIYFKNSSNVVNCSFINCSGFSSGGAIYFKEPGNVSNCIFVNCSSSSSSYIIRSFGGAIYFGGIGNVINCIFENCSCYSFYNFSFGGAISFGSSGCAVNCAFMNNNASNGNAIRSSSQSILINNNWWGSNNPNWNSLIYGVNKPSSFGILNVTANPQNITTESKSKLNYVFYKNGTSDIVHIPIRPIELSSDGGFLENTSGYLINSEFSTEFNSDEEGIYEITAKVDNENIKIQIEVTDSPSNIWYVNSSKTSSGDGKSEETAFKTLQDALNNAADGDTIMIASGIYEGYENIGLSIGKQVEIKSLDSGVIFDGNNNHIFTITQNNTAITGIMLKNGVYSGKYTNGGAISFSAGLNNISIINCSFINNKAGCGGAISFSDYLNNINIINCSFFNNTVTSTSSTGGGAIALGTFGYNITIKDCYFFNNSARNHGGAIYCFDINNCTFENLSFFMNTAQGRGGAINIYDSGTNILFKNIFFINNFAGNYAGGAVYCSHMFNSNFESISFINNSCVDRGGAISFRNAMNVNLTNSLFLNNIALSGGAINYFGGDSCIINCSFIDNAANQGGAIFNQKTIFVFNSNFINNNATKGSAIMWDSGNGLVNNSIFINNKGTDTGTIHIMSDNIVVSKSILINNTDPYDIYSTRYLIDADYNWFGNNETNYNQHPRVSSNVVTDSWLFLNATANATLIPINNNSRITFKLDSYNSKSEKFSPYNASKMNVQLDLSQTLGELNRNTTFIGENVVYTAKQSGYASVTCKFETTSYTINLKNTDNKKEYLTISASAQPITVGDDVTVVVTGLENATGNVTVTVNGKSYNASIMDGGAKVIIPGLTESVIASVNYPGDSKYNSASTTVKITVNPKPKENLTISASAKPITVGENANVIVTGLEDATGEVIVTIGSNKWTGKINKGTANVAIPGLTESVIASVNYPGDSKYNSASTTVKITVNPKPKENLTISASAEPITVGEDVTVVVTGLEDATGDVSVIANGKTYTAPIKNGESTVLVSGLTENVAANVNYPGNDKYNPASTTVKITVNKISDYNITAEDLTIYKGQSAEIVVNVPSDATGNILLRILSDEYILPVIDGKATVIISDLSDYSMCGFFAFLVDDPKYEMKSVYGTITIIPKESDYNIYSPDVDVYCGETANITVYLPQDATGRLKVLYDGLDVGYVYINEGVATFEATYQISCIHTFNFYYEGNYKYVGKSTSAILTVHEISDYSFNTTDVYISTGEIANIIANLPKDATGTANIRVFNENFEYAASTTVDNGQIIFNVDGLLKDAQFIIDYLGDYRYESKSVYGSIFVKSNIIINAPDITKYYGGSEKFIVTLTDKNIPIADADVVITIGGETIARTTDSNGKVFVDLNQNMGIYVVTINYKDLFNISNVIILSAPTKTVLSGVKNINMGDSLTVTANVNATTGSVTFKVGSNTQKIDIVNNKASYTVTDLSEGFYNISATYDDANGNYLTSSDSASFTVSKISPKLSVIADDIGEGQDAIFEITTNEDCTGDINVLIDGKNFKNTLSNGKTIIKVPNLTAGDYNYTVSFLGDEKYGSKSLNGTLNVKNINVILNAPDLIKYYGSKDKLSAQLLDKSNKPLSGQKIIFTVNGKDYERITDNLGIASMNINLISGNHIANVRFEGNGTYDAIKTTVEIQIKPTVSGKDVTKIYKNGTQYYATFVDTDGNLLKNTDVEFNINGVFYTRKTNDYGVARMNINLNPGEYIITAKNPNSGEQYTNLIKVLPSIVENYDLTKYYKNASQYTLRILGDNGKPVGEGVEVKLNINGVFYTRTTNASGYINMNINLPPGTYIITAEYNGLMASNKITVLSVLETHNLVMKYKDGSQFKAKILDGQGKPYAGQTVTFNINGVFYTKTTEADGIARLKINLLAGEYIITSMYNGLNAANKVTISG